MTNAVALRAEPRAMTNEQYYRERTDVAGICREIVMQTARTIQGRRYVQVEGWQAIAAAAGCSIEVGEVRRVTDEGASGFAATAYVRRLSDGAIVGQGEGFVGDDESMWAKRPVFARRAMAQTRASSRACRSAFAFIVVLIDAGLSTTPAEEMDGVVGEDAHPATPPAPQAKRARDVKPAPKKDDPAAIAKLREMIAASVDRATWEAADGELTRLQRDLSPEMFDELAGELDTKRDDLQRAAAATEGGVS